MGCSCSKPPPPTADEDPVVLSSQTHFTVKDVKALNELFRKLSSSIPDDNFITREKFQLGLFNNSRKQSLFSDRMFDLFDSDNDGLIEFRDFVRSLSIFHPDAPHAEKAMFAFQLYDVWKTGFIERKEVKLMILAFLDESELILNDDIVQAIIDKTFEQADTNGDGIIDPEEWRNFTAQNPSILNNMTIPHLRDLPTRFPNFEPTSEDSELEDETAGI